MKFFEVSETPVRYQDLVDPGIFKRYPGKKIIVNHDLNQGISLVGSGFLVVKHKEAFDLGVEVFELLFGVTPLVHKESLSPGTTDYCVDLVSDECKIVFDRMGYRFVGPTETAVNHRSTFIDDERDQLAPSSRSRSGRYLDYVAETYHDVYHPFIRVTNYLREGSPFTIELGYYRKRCSNGLLYDATSKLTFRHEYDVSDFQMIKGAAIDHFRRYKRNFMSMAEKLWKLLLIHIPKAQIRLISFDIFEDQIRDSSPEVRRNLLATLSDLVDKYVEEIGENMNAALNVATEFSKLLEGDEVSPSTIQSMATDWINRVTRKSFNLESYLSRISNIEERVVNAV